MRHTEQRTPHQSSKIITMRFWFALCAVLGLAAIALSGVSVPVASSSSRGAAVEQAANPVSGWLDNVPTVYGSDQGAAPLALAATAAPLAPAPVFMPASVSDSITLADPTFVRPSAGAITTCPPSGNPTTHYKLYEFNLSGCAVASPVTIDTCASGV